MTFMTDLRLALEGGREDARIKRTETVEDSRQFVGQMRNLRTEADSPVYLALCEAAGVDVPPALHQESCGCNGGCNCFIPK